MPSDVSQRSTYRSNDSNKPREFVSGVSLAIALWQPLPSIAASPESQQQQHRHEILATKLSDTKEFKNLRRELPVSRAVKELNDLKDLQDSRLDACADRGEMWEQCFMFGDSESKSSGADRGGSNSAGGGSRAKKGGSNPTNGLDYQLISPIGAFDPGQASAAAEGRQKTIPTW